MVLVHMTRKTPSDHLAAFARGGGAIHGLASMHGGGAGRLTHVGHKVVGALANETARQAPRVFMGRTNGSDALRSVVAAGGHAAVDAAVGKRGGGAMGRRKAKRARLM